MVSRAYGKSLSDEEIEDVYAAAWAATLSALRTRGESMGDEELRAYVLTAVASHASKELRRRSRKPAGSLNEAHGQIVTDTHQPLPEERAIGSESQGVARDLLMSLPPRRRAVMLLRYGWGLSPNEVCALVTGLSSRAYRKEVTRGVEQLIERLEQVDSGEWCKSREPLLRDYVAGTADEDVRRQVGRHLEHCRACSVFTARLTSHLHDFGGLVALSAIAGSIGERKVSALDRIAGLVQHARDGAGNVVEKSESTIGSVAASGGARGSGAAGAGVLAKLAGLGGAGKAALACLGASAAASACVAAGVVPGVSLGDFDFTSDSTRQHRSPQARQQPPDQQAPAAQPTPGRSDLGVVPVQVAPSEQATATPEEGGQEPRDEPAVPVSEPATPVEQEFDPLAASAPDPVDASPPPSSPPTGSSGGSPPASGAAGEEFGP